MLQRIHEWDLTVLRLLNPSVHTVWIPILQAISDTATQLAYGVPAMLILWAVLRMPGRPRLMNGIYLLCTVLVADYAALFVKNGVERRRPYELYEWITRYSDGGNYSFPSGHATMATAMAVGLCLIYPRSYVVVPALLWAGAVGFSRVYLGVHYPSDVIAAMLLSLIVALLLYGVLRRVKK